MDFPTPSCLQADPHLGADFIPRLSVVVAQAIEQADWVFSFQSQSQTYNISTEEMAAPDGFLPIILHRASHWMSQSMGDRALMGFRIDARGISRCVPEPIGATASLAIWALYAQFALDEWVSRHPEQVRSRKPVPIDDLVSAFDNDLALQAIPVLPALVSPAQRAVAPQDGSLTGL